jgi:hypothetical protein
VNETYKPLEIENEGNGVIVDEDVVAEISEAVKDAAHPLVDLLLVEQSHPIDGEHLLPVDLTLIFLLVVGEHGTKTLHMEGHDLDLSQDQGQDRQQ